MQIFVVGGYVRDEIMGIPSKDVDFSVVLNDADMFDVDNFPVYRGSPFNYMVARLKREGFTVFLETPEHLTVRAQFPSGDGGFGLTHLGGGPAKPGSKRLTADFVLARKESGYSDGRRPDAVQPGTLADDLARRDFTMNAVAKASDGTYIDPHNGQVDIAARIIRAVGDPHERLREDALRALRALRFSVTKGFTISPELRFAMHDAGVLHSIVTNISDERKREELHKMFSFDTVASMKAMIPFPALTEAVFSGSVWMDASMKGRK